MRGLAPPDPAQWRARVDWFWRAHDINAGPQPLDLDPRASALLGELETAFGVGAWAAVILLAWTLVEGAARASEEAARDLDWLRERRNELAHADGDNTLDEDALRQHAEGAVRTVFKTLFAAAWMKR